MIELPREVMIMEDNLMMIIMVISIVFGGVVLGVNRMKNKKPSRLELKGVDEERAALLQEKYNKAVDDFNFLEQRVKSPKDKELTTRLKALQSIGKNILKQMEKNPDRILLAAKFVDYYQDRAVRMVQKFDELDETELTTERVRELKDKIKNTLGGLEAAYEEQLEKIVNDQMLSTEAEIRVMEEHLRSEGITRKDSSTNDLSDDDEKIFEAIPVRRNDQIRPVRPDDLNRSLIPDGDRPAVVKQKMIQSLLAIFLGTVGAHKFYQGKTWQGVLYFLFSWTTIPTWVGMLEGIRYLFMPTDDFYKQYIKK